MLGVVGIIAGLSGGVGKSSASSAPATRPLPAITRPAPPQAAAESKACAKVLAALPVTLRGLDQRVVHTVPETPSVVAWGQPPVVLSCGVGRPRSLHANSGAEYFSTTGTAGPYFDVTSAGTDQIFTTVDRAAYISIAIPVRYHSGPLPTLARDIAAALPAVCKVDSSAPRSRLCTRRP